MPMGIIQSRRPCVRRFTKTYQWQRQILNLDFFFFKIYLFGCAGSLLLHAGSLYLQRLVATPH